MSITKMYPFRYRKWRLLAVLELLVAGPRNEAKGYASHQFEAKQVSVDHDHILRPKMVMFDNYFP